MNSDQLICEYELPVCNILYFCLLFMFFLHKKYKNSAPNPVCLSQILIFFHPEIRKRAGERSSLSYHKSHKNENYFILTISLLPTVFSPPPPPTSRPCVLYCALLACGRIFLIFPIPFSFFGGNAANSICKETSTFLREIMPSSF
jgi:hypothetical protein